MKDTTDTPPLKLAAPAPEEEDDGSEASADAQVLAGQPDLHALCEDWAYWCRTRRFYVKPSLPVSLLGKLTSKGTGRSSSGGPDAATSAELSAFHIAFTAQPEDALDRRVFELHYYYRVRNVKSAAAALGVSRQHWYRLVADCRARVYAASRQILEQREGERAELLQRLDLNHGR
jgi:hypothetical protein